MLAYVLDPGLRQRCTDAERRNHWDVYIEEMCTQLGVRGQRLSLRQLEEPAALSSVGCLVLGRQSGAEVSRQGRANLASWVKEGGLLIGFALCGLDDLFGIRQEGFIRQGTLELLPPAAAAAGGKLPDEYAIGGYFDLLAHPLTEGIHSRLAPQQKLIIASDLVAVAAAGATPLATLWDAHGADLDRPAVTWHAHGEGHAAYFCFDVAQTVWLLHQGRPIRGPVEDDPYARSWQLQIIGGNSKQVAYADELVFLLQNLVAQSGQPFVYPSPPLDGRVPDALFYWGGDCGPAGQDMVIASDWMKGKGLPYHINVRPHLEPEGFLDRYLHVLANGHEVSIYYEVDPRRGVVPELLLWQSNYAREHYGLRPGSSVLGPCVWTGWAEPARWLVAAGNTADNSLVATDVPLSHPKMNDSFYGSGFGTFFPYFFYDDHRHGNARIDLVEQPVTWYELGHHGSVGDRQTRNAADVHEAVDMALTYHHVTNLFYHPGYIADFPLCRAAIEEILRYIGERGALVLHMADNEAAEWWRARSRSSVERLPGSDGTVRLRSRCHHLGGMVVKLLWPPGTVAAVTCDGKAAPHQLRREFGGTWLHVVVPPGEHTVTVALA